MYITDVNLISLLLLFLIRKKKKLDLWQYYNLILFFKKYIEYVLHQIIISDEQIFSLSEYNLRMVNIYFNFVFCLKLTLIISVLQGSI